MTVPGLDHIVIDVGDRFDEAERRYRPRFPADAAGDA